MVKNQYKKYTASQIKNKLSDIFLDANKAPVVISRRGSDPYVLLTKKSFDSLIKSKKSSSVVTELKLLKKQATSKQKDTKKDKENSKISYYLFQKRY